MIYSPISKHFSDNFISDWETQKSSVSLEGLEKSKKDNYTDVKVKRSSL